MDKFAQLPWKGETAALFGRFTTRCERYGFLSEDLERADWESRQHLHTGTAPVARIVGAQPTRPPDLIIQDELHLISGPLGSLVGLRFTEHRIGEWERRTEVRRREQLVLVPAHEQWRRQRRLAPDNWPGLRYVLLHT